MTSESGSHYTNNQSKASTNTSYTVQDEDIQSLNRLKNRLIQIREQHDIVRVAIHGREPVGDLEIPPNVVAEIKILEHQLKAKKSKVRVKRMREIQDDLRNAFFDLKKSPDKPETIKAFKNHVLAIQGQINIPYNKGQAFLREKEGMAQVRPYMERQIEKLDSLRHGNRIVLERLLKGESKLHDDLHHFNNPLPPLEKAVLVSLSRLLDQMIELYLEGTANSSLSKITVKSFRSNPSSDKSPDYEQGNFDIFDAHTRLFSLRSKLRTAPESEIQKYKLEIEKLEKGIKSHRKN